MNLFKTLGQMFDPTSIISTSLIAKDDIGIVLEVELGIEFKELRIPIEIVEEWAKFDAKLEDTTFEVYYYAQMDFDNFAGKQLAKYCIQYHKNLVK